MDQDLPQVTINIIQIQFKDTPPVVGMNCITLKPITVIEIYSINYPP